MRRPLRPSRSKGAETHRNAVPNSSPVFELSGAIVDRSGPMLDFLEPGLLRVGVSRVVEAFEKLSRESSSFHPR